jgi:tetratricopeptide (TPR) repeat protein
MKLLKSVNILIVIATSLISLSGQSQMFEKDKYEAFEKYFRVGDSLMNNKEFVSAIKSYSKALEILNDERVIFARGLSYYLSKSFNEAILDFTDVIRIDKLYVKEAYFYRAMNKFNLSDNDKNFACIDLLKSKELGFIFDEKD